MGESQSLQEMGISVISALEGPPAKGLRAPIEIAPLADVTHIERHWGDVELGSVFETNDHFGDAREMVELLEIVSKEIITPEQRNRPFVITLEFDAPIGRVGVTETIPGEGVTREIRDGGGRGEVEVNVVERSEKPPTNLLTFEMRPKFPPKGSQGKVTYQVWAAFPGEAMPSLFSRDPADIDFWKTHAFIKVSE